jgi:hypothetical protein
MPRHLPVLGAAVDKYAVPNAEVPCAENLPLCKAICCSLVVILGQQDLDEGVMAWDEARPYWNRLVDGRCSHFAGGCSIYAQRPAPCRSFDCRTDRRIWLDYDRRIPNPNLERLAVISANARAMPPIGEH